MSASVLEPSADRRPSVLAFFNADVVHPGSVLCVAEISSPLAGLFCFGAPFSSLAESFSVKRRLYCR